MTDPTTITAGALLAKACQDLIGEAAKSTWAALGRLVDVVRARIAPESPAQTALSRVEKEPANPQRVMDLIAELDPYVRDDPIFRQELIDVIAELSKEPDIGQFVTQVFDNARVGKLVIIDTVHGDVSF